MQVTNSSTAKQEEKVKERGSCNPLRAFGFFYRKKKEKEKRQIIQTEKSNF